MAGRDRHVLQVLLSLDLFEAAARLPPPVALAGAPASMALASGTPERNTRVFFA